MKRRAYSFILLVIIVIYTFLYKAFLFSHFMKYSEMINASFLMIVLYLSYKMFGMRKNKETFDSERIMKATLLYLLVTFIIMYGLGLRVGFLKNAYSLSALSIINNILSPILVIISLEIIRYLVIWANKDRKYYIIIFTFILSIFEICISSRSLMVKDFSELFRLTATVLLPITIKNAVLSYLCYEAGYKVPMIYRLVMDLYLFVVPVIPDLGEYVNSMILIALPSLVCISSFSIIEERKDKNKYVYSSKTWSIWDIPFAVFLVILISLISGIFPHYLIGVGSNSMSPAIHKGDAVILKKVNKKQTLNRGDIIAYQKDNITVVHRIKEVTLQNGKRVYLTKGDANNGMDTDPVKPKQVKGIVKLRIPFVAYPTIWVKEFFTKEVK